MDEDVKFWIEITNLEMEVESSRARGIKVGTRRIEKQHSLSELKLLLPNL